MNNLAHNAFTILRDIVWALGVIEIFSAHLALVWLKESITSDNQEKRSKAERRSAKAENIAFCITIWIVSMTVALAILRAIMGY